MLGNPQASPKISANQRQANTCFHILNVKVSTFGNIWIAYKYSLLKRFVLAKWRRFLTASDSEFTGFSVEDLTLAEENYARVTQEQIGDISDLDISNFSDDEDENEILNTTIQYPFKSETLVSWDAGP